MSESYFNVHEFSGSWREIGRQYGETCREEIGRMLEYWRKALASVVPGKDLPELFQATHQFEAPIRQYSPELFEEIQGIAEGANLPLEEILFHQGSFEMDVAGPLYLGGCTGFAASGTATRTGETLAGQHFDWYDGADMIVMRVHPNDGPSFLGVTIAGQLAQFGINSCGVAHFANVLAYPKSIVGVPAVVVGQNVLRSKNVADGIRCITQAQNAIALNHLLAGKDGDIIDVEATPDRCGIVLPNRDILTHSNHFLTPFLQEYDLAGQTSFPDTFLRQYRLYQLMDDRRGSLDVECMMNLMQDHRGYPDSICRHADLTGPESEQFRTLISMISLPAKGEMWISPQPCQYPYELVTL